MAHDIPEAEARDDSAKFGIWPSMAGLGFGVLIMVVMFVLATGFR
jgi:hypothetical protein